MSSQQKSFARFTPFMHRENGDWQAITDSIRYSD
jgi:hypothetical protein